MRIAPINNLGIKKPANFNANLWVDKDVAGVVEENRDTFSEAADRYDAWLRTEKADVPYTMYIRKNTALNPKMFRTLESVVTHEYPYEECGYTINRVFEHRENLEFDMNNRKCGFWFNPKSNADQLFNDFKTMFENIYNNKI